MGEAFKTLATYAPLARLADAEFRKRIAYPVLLVGASAAPMGGPRASTDTTTASLTSLPLDEMVVSLEPKPGQGFLVIGRGSSADVLLPFETISRSHARLVIDTQGKLLLSDQGSKNGTYLNGERLVPQRTYVLKDGDQVKLGDLEGTLLLPDSFHRVLQQQ